MRIWHFSDGLFIQVLWIRGCGWYLTFHYKQIQSVLWKKGCFSWEGWGFFSVAQSQWLTPAFSAKTSTGLEDMPTCPDWATELSGWRPLCPHSHWEPTRGSGPGVPPESGFHWGGCWQTPLGICPEEPSRWTGAPGVCLEKMRWAELRKWQDRWSPSQVWGPHEQTYQNPRW